MGLPSKACWTGSQPVQLIEKNSETLQEDSSKNKKSKKKKRCSIWSLDEGEPAKTMQRVPKMGLPSRTYWTGSQLVQLIEKISKTLPEDSSKNKKSKKKTNDAQFRARMRENRPKQCNVFLVEGQTRATQPFYKIQKNFKTESSSSLSEKTPRSPHQSSAPYSLLSFHSGFLYQNPYSYVSRRGEGATKERRRLCHGGKGRHPVWAQNLPELDRLISYIQASIILQHRLKRRQGL